MNSICISTDELLLPVLGLDIAKASVQAELRIKGRKVRFGFANNAKGFAQLARILEQQDAPKIWAGLEATGPYSQALALWLHAQGHRVSLLNPRRVKQYAQSAGRRNKTDRLDAAILADFVCAMKPALWQPPTLEVAQLQALVRRREELCVMLQAEKNRLEGVASNVRPSLERVYRYTQRGEDTLGKTHHPTDPLSPPALPRSSTLVHHQRDRLAHRRHPACRNGASRPGRARPASCRSCRSGSAPGRKRQLDTS
jgi:hypothetical protein